MYNKPLHTYVVSLERDVERRAAITRQLNNLDLPFSVEPGVLVEDMAQCKPEEYNDLEAYHSESVRNNPRYVKAVVGAKRATLNVLRRAFADNEGKDGWVLMLEDDAELPAEQEDMADVLERAGHAPSNCSVILLWHHQAHSGQVDMHAICTLGKYRRGMVAYLVRPAIIPTLVAMLEKSGYEADCVWEKLDPAVSIVCEIDCVQTTQSQSNIISGIPELLHIAK